MGEKLLLLLSGVVETERKSKSMPCKARKAQALQHVTRLRRPGATRCPRAEF